MKVLQPKPFLHCRRIVGGAASLVLSFGLVACALTGQQTAAPAPGLSGTVTGTVTYRERIALPPDAVVEVVLLDVSRMDVAATILAQQVIGPKQQVPIPFVLDYDPTAIDTRMSYAVRATIKRGDKLLFVTDRNYPVLTRGHSESVDLVLVRSGGGAAPVADASLANTRWLLRTLEGESVELRPDQRPPFLQFEKQDGSDVARGFAGCNNFTGGYTVAGEALDFGNLASTMRACPFMALEDRFYRVLEQVERYAIRGTWLMLYGPGGEVATLEAWYE